MQVELLRSLIDTALSEPDQETQIGVFWCFAQNYDNEVPLIKALFSSESVVSIESDGLVIMKTNDEFVIVDHYGRSDVFTYQEIQRLIFLWDESFNVKVNTIIME